MNKIQYRPVLYFLGQFKLIYGAIVVLIFVGAALESISVAAFFPVIALVISDSPDDTAGILGFTRDVVDALPFSDPVIGASFLLIGAFVAKGLTILMRDGLINYGGAKVTYTVKKEVMDRYAGANYQFFLDNKQGDLIFNSTHAPIAVGALLTLGPQMLALFGKLIALGVLLALVFPLAALGFAVLGLTYYICVHFLSIKLSWRYSQNTVRAHSEQTVDYEIEFWVGMSLIAAVATMWNFHAIAKDVWPAKMGITRMEQKLKKLVVETLSTYDTACNKPFLDALPEEILDRYQIRYITTLNGVSEGYVVIPAINSKAPTFQSSKIGWSTDNELDPLLSSLLDSKMIHLCAVGHYPTYGNSRYWPQIAEIPSYRDFFLNDVHDEDRWKGLGWILDGRKLQTAINGTNNGQNLPQ
jgi:hypothetical protein